MQLDPSIILGYRSPEINSPNNALAKMLQVQGAQQQLEAGRWDLDAKRSEREQNNKLMQFLSTNPDLTSAEGRSGLYRAAPLKADGIIEGRLKTQKAGTDAEQAAFKLANERYGTYRQALGALSAMPNLSKDMVLQVGQELVTNGVLPAEMFQRSMQNMPDDPEALRQTLRSGLAAQLKPDQVFSVFGAKPEKFDNGQQIITRDMNPNSPTYGQNTGGAPIQKMQSPDSIASNATSRRGQDLKFQTDSGANAVAGQAIVSKKIQDVELKLQDDYRTESKGFAETSTAMKKVLSAIETADKNPGSALSAGTAFMKILDPNSVVRETELGMALNASGWFDRATNIVNTLQSGRVMTPTQKKNLRDAANDLFEEAKASQREVDAAYAKRATDYGADPKRVIVDRGQTGGSGSKAPARVGALSLDDINAELARRQGGR